MKVFLREGGRLFSHIHISGVMSQEVSAVSANSLPWEVREKYDRFNRFLLPYSVGVAESQGAFYPNASGEGRLDVRENYGESRYARKRRILDQLQMAAQDPYMSPQRQAHLKFMESAVELLDNARQGIRESFGPRAGGAPSAFGTGGDIPPHFPHYRPRPVRGDVRWLPGLSPEEEEKRLQFLRHEGLRCEQAHGVMPHRVWVEYAPGL